MHGGFLRWLSDEFLLTNCHEVRLRDAKCLKCELHSVY